MGVDHDGGDLVRQGALGLPAAERVPDQTVLDAGHQISTTRPEDPDSHKPGRGVMGSALPGRVCCRLWWSHRMGLTLVAK